jgi:hypothetical protein
MRNIDNTLEHTGILALVGEELVDLVTSIAIRNLDVVLGGAVVRHEGQEAVVGDVQLFPVSASILILHLSMYILTSWYSRRETFGTSMLWVDGDKSSNFLPVKMSMATMWTLA